MRIWIARTFSALAASYTHTPSLAPSLILFSFIFSNQRALLVHLKCNTVKINLVIAIKERDLLTPLRHLTSSEQITFSQKLFTIEWCRWLCRLCIYTYFSIHYVMVLNQKDEQYLLFTLFQAKSGKVAHTHTHTKPFIFAPIVCVL